MKNFKLPLLLLAAGAAIAVLIMFWTQSFQNTALSLEEQVHSAKSDINIQEKRRADLIPNLVDCVKAYDKHEYETLMGVIEARGVNNDEAAEEIKTMINAVAEAYPELQSNDNYKELMNELATTENLIARYRENYNKQIKEYSKYVRKFPNRILLDTTGYEVQEFEYLEYNVSSDAPTNLFD